MLLACLGLLSVDIYLDECLVKARHRHGDSLEPVVADVVTLDWLAALRNHHDQRPGLGPHRTFANILNFQLEILRTLTWKI